MEGNWTPKGANGEGNKYQYNGKELNDDFGLGWNDYGARFYDAAVGRWGVVDPWCEKYKQSSPYCYVENNPARFIDIEGKFKFDPKTIELLKTKYPTAYKFFIEMDGMSQFTNDRNIAIMIKNTRHYQASLKQSKGKRVML
jgi:RHS repeat-associated protein